MKVKRYIASTSREALRQVKEELGVDAVILSNRKTRNGVEIMALADSEMSDLVHIQMPSTLPSNVVAHHEQNKELRTTESYSTMQPLVKEPT